MKQEDIFKIIKIALKTKKRVDLKTNTKNLSEEILMKFCKENYYFKNISLRYFNPIGAHKSNMIGENPKGIQTNLVPLITKNCIGKNVELKIFGYSDQNLFGFSMLN